MGELISLSKMKSCDNFIKRRQHFLKCKINAKNNNHDHDIDLKWFKGGHNDIDYIYVSKQIHVLGRPIHYQVIKDSDWWWRIWYSYETNCFSLLDDKRETFLDAMKCANQHLNKRLQNIREWYK